MSIPGSVHPLFLGAAGQAGESGYQIERSLRFNSPDSAYLSRTPASSGNRKTWTWAGWVKRSKLAANNYLIGAASDANNYAGLFFNSSDQITFVHIPNANTINLVSSAVFRDTSAWYHVTCSVDTTQASSSNGVKMYVNGTLVSLGGAYTQNADTLINSTSVQGIGSLGSSYIGQDGYLAECFFLDGIAADPSSFTETDATTGQLIPKAYSGSYGSNGWKLSFSDNSTAAALGTDSSSNGNTWTVNNISVTAGAGNDSLVDSPVNGSQVDTGVGGEVVGNYATWNPLTGAITLTNGNLDGNSTGGAWRGATGTVGVLSGKWYWESTIQNTDSGNYYGEFGFIKTTDITGAITFPSGMNGIVYYARNGRKISGGTSVVTSSSGATTGDVVQVAVDLDAGKIWFGVNNTWVDSGNPASGTNAAYTGLSGTYLPVIGVFDGGKCNTNFGQRAFAYTAPSGFKALTTANLPTPTIANGATAIDVKLYTGNGSTQTISGLNFSPDLVWIKGRSGATDHALYDVVRGTQARLESNTTDAEVTSDSGLTAFNSDGFALSTLAQVNTSSDTYAAWTWDAGSSTVTNTAGSISSQVRANASAGFSVVTYTGNGTNNATVGHGLGVAPRFLIGMDRTGGNWQVWGANMNNGSFDCIMNLNNTDALSTGITTRFRAASSTTFTIGTDGDINANGNTYVTYCFAPVAGYSAFGSYTGDGNADGPFVFCNFRPRWILIKQATSSGDGWYIYDAQRIGYNPTNLYLWADGSNEEQTSGNFDLLSNGFKLRTTASALNYTGYTYIYAAFGDPFAYARAR